MLHQMERKKMVGVLIKNNTNCESSISWTPVNIATNLGHLEVMKYLLLIRQIWILNNYNETTLLLQLKKKIKMENLLINNGAKVSLIEIPKWYEKNMFMDFMRIYLKQLVN